MLAQVAKKHPYTKFIKIVATKCIENYLDMDVPGILIYKDGDLADKIIPAAPVFGGKHMTVDTVEFVLAMKKIIDMELPEVDPRAQLKQFNMKTQKKGTKNEELSDEEDGREYTNTQMF